MGEESGRSRGVRPPKPSFAALVATNDDPIPHYMIEPEPTEDPDDQPETEDSDSEAEAHDQIIDFDDAQSHTESDDESGDNIVLNDESGDDVVFIEYDIHEE